MQTTNQNFTERPCEIFWFVWSKLTTMDSIIRHVDCMGIEPAIWDISREHNGLIGIYFMGFYKPSNILMLRVFLKVFREGFYVDIMGFTWLTTFLGVIETNENEWSTNPLQVVWPRLQGTKLSMSGQRPRMGEGWATESIQGIRETCWSLDCWLVVWNMTFMTFHILGMLYSQLTKSYFSEG